MIKKERKRKWKKERKKYKSGRIERREKDEWNDMGKKETEEELMTKWMNET